MWNLYIVPELRRQGETRHRMLRMAAQKRGPKWQYTGQAMRTHKLLATVAGLMYVSPGHAQSSKGPFQILETTIDDVHAAYKSGKLTARQLVQGYLDRIDEYDKQGPRINSIITLNPK